MSLHPSQRIYFHPLLFRNKTFFFFKVILFIIIYVNLFFFFFVSRLWKEKDSVSLTEENTFHNLVTVAFSTSPEDVSIMNLSDAKIVTSASPARATTVKVKAIVKRLRVFLRNNMT